MSAQPLPIGIILLAHGSRDPLWSKPIEAIAHQISQAPSECLVRCAYLELMTPSLASAVLELSLLGVTRIRIAPMFLGLGKHVKEDLPEITQQLAEKYPHLQLSLLPSLGEHPVLIRAISNILTQRL